MIRALALLPLLAACAPAPMTLDRAERSCRADLAQADGVSGSIGAGIGSGGPSASGRITVTNRVFTPQSEEDFLADCIARRTSGAPEPTTVGITLGGRT